MLTERSAMTMTGVDVHGPDQIAIETRPLPQGVVIEVSGEVDLATASTLERELLRAEQAHWVVAIDLTNVSFLDSTGLHAIMDANLRLRDRGGRLLIVQGPPQVSRVFELTGLSDHLDLVPDEAELGRLAASAY